MHGFASFFTKDWFLFLDAYQQDQVRVTFELLQREERLHSAFHDYSFLVFPLSKVYEGFLKKYFYTAAFIDKQTYESKHFRIGRSLNPDVYPDRRDTYWLYDKVVAHCGKDTAALLWHVWLTHRNHLFHDFVTARAQLSVEQAKVALFEITQAMSVAMRCRLQKGHYSS